MRIPYGYPAPRFCLRQNACTAQTRRPAVRGPGLVRHLYFADKPKRNTSRQAGVSFWLPAGKALMRNSPLRFEFMPHSRRAV